MSRSVVKQMKNVFDLTNVSDSETPVAMNFMGKFRVISLILCFFVCSLLFGFIVFFFYFPLFNVFYIWHIQNGLRPPRCTKSTSHQRPVYRLSHCLI